MSDPAQTDKLFDPANHPELIELIKKLTLKDPEAMAQYVADAFGGKAVDELVADVAKGRDSINKVKAAFVTIGASLAAVDEKKLVLDGKPLKAFAPEWQGIAQLFNDIMIDKIADVVIEILLDHNTKKSEACELLGHYQTKVKEEQKDAEAIGTKLTNLHNSLNNFQATLKTALEKDSAIAKQIEEVRGRIAGVDRKIAEFESLINGCMWSAIGGGIATFAGMLLTLTPLAPLGIALIFGGVGSAAGAGIAAEKWGHPLHAARKEKAELQAELAQLIKTQEDLQQVHGMLAKVTGDWDDIKGGLAAISSIWGTFATNLTRIDESIASTTHDLEQEGKVWQHAYLRQLKLMQTIYAALSKMLVQWSANVTTIYPEAPPPYKA
ncbi:hypothetical protein K523DRAFT_348999 [Schizophyllum commune Tattone D]|nr:hypothetical protein K523DRAFT_348999 [Schizophyllum commune Tattone D]